MDDKGQDRTVEIEVPVEAVWKKNDGTDAQDFEAGSRFIWLRVYAG